MRPCRFIWTFLFATTACAMGKTSVPEGAEVTWADMDQGQRMAHMGKVVEPRMKALFQEHDSARFSDFGCTTCHAENTFEMPNPELPRISKTGFYKKHRKQHPEILRFMWKTMEPNMADALGVTYGEKGYLGCSSCHRIEE